MSRDLHIEIICPLTVVSQRSSDQLPTRRPGVAINLHKVYGIDLELAGLIRVILTSLGCSSLLCASCASLGVDNVCGIELR